MSLLPEKNELGFYEMRFESIGGLGANLAAQVLAEAVILGQKLDGANFASYGSEKKGSPVKAFIRLCERGTQVRTSSPVERPNLLVVFHEALLKNPGTTQGLLPDSIVLVNTAGSPERLRDVLSLSSGTVAVVNALEIAVTEKTRINTALLGAVARVCPFLDKEAIKRAIASAFEKRYPQLVEPNLRTFERGYTCVNLREYTADGKYPVREFRRYVPALGYKNAPMGGVITTPGNSAEKDLSISRQGYIPQLDLGKCTHCSLCEMTCPDLCFNFAAGTDKKGRPAQELQGINYQYCKGCLKCVEVCPTGALTTEREVSEGALPAAV